MREFRRGCRQRRTSAPAPTNPADTTASAAHTAATTAQHESSRGSSQQPSVDSSRSQLTTPARERAESKLSVAYTTAAVQHEPSRGTSQQSSEDSSRSQLISSAKERAESKFHSKLESRLPRKAQKASQIPMESNGILNQSLEKLALGRFGAHQHQLL